MTPGIHLLHKPVGPTSFSLVQAAIKSVPPEHKAPRICHGGTLDPFASGLLLILVEPATRLFNYLHDIPKTYQATVRWGVETDNGDPHGQVTFTGEASGLTPEKLESALAGFIGWHDQVPHPTSASAHSMGSVRMSGHIEAKRSLCRRRGFICMRRDGSAMICRIPVGWNWFVGAGITFALWPVIWEN